MFKNTPSSAPLSMPILEHIKQVFQSEFGSDFSKLPNRHTTLFVIVQHGFITIRPMMDIFLEMGIPSDHVFMTTKPHTTSSDMLAYFQETFGIHYIPFQWSAADSTVERPSPYKRLTALTHDRLFEKFCDYLLRYPAPAYIQNIIICDEGGKFLNSFIERYHNPDNRYLKKLSDYHVVAIEHTKCGTYGEALRRLPFPLINMADSYLKTQIESEFIAKSMFVNLQSVLTRLIDSSPVTIGVVGAGNIGREVLYFLFREYPTASIIIYDHEPSVLSQAKIIEKGWSNVSRADSIQSLFQQATIILGCTGKDITTTLSLDAIAENPANQIHLISCSSGDTEFQTLLRRIPDYKFESLVDIRDWTMPLNTNGDKQLTIYNGGFPMNFLVEQGAPAPESVPLEEVQVTRSMKLAALVQALKLLDVTSYIPDESSLAGYIQLDMLYQWEIIQALYRDLMSSTSSEKQARAQDQYARITQQEITQGSVGTQQPSMNSVLKIPHYVTTHYQIRMEKQLFDQQRPIKLLVIHGTTGSGKTTLAQHYLHKQRIQNPKHLHRTLLAETTTQWRSQLRDWAEELFPELNTILNAEQDLKKQDRIVNQHLQKSLCKKTWCVVIDNWDQNAFPIIEIEKLFLNADVNVGKGTLLITTQGQSSHGEAQSLDLSQGFAPDESQGLLIKVMNLEEELAMTWTALGNNENLQALTQFLNHLPLAVVLAGSYIMWENKSRRREGQPLFTFREYQQLLEQHVAEIILTHDERLGIKSNVPREERAEFIRVKTQEAAVDLSLKKAIRPGSTNPNMNLWHMLCFCGFLASDGIPQQLLKNHLEQLSNVMGIPQKETFDEVLSLAQGYSLLLYENTVSFTDNLSRLHIHRVIQHVLKDKYWPMLLLKIIPIATETEFSTESIVCEPMVKALLQLFSPAVEKQDFEIIRAFLPHVDMCITHWGTASTREALSYEGAQENLQTNLANAHHLLGNNRHAKHLYCELLNAFIEHHKKQPAFALTIARTQQNLAGVLIALGEYQEGLDLYQTALAAKRIHCNEEMQVEVATTQQGLASALSSLGLNDEAESIFQEALSTLLIHCKPHERIKIAITQQNFASTLSKLGRNNEAAELYVSALSIMREHHQNEEHIEIAETKQNFAIVLAKLGQHENAVNFYQESLPIITQHYGIHGQYKLALTQRCFANSLFFLKNYIEAENWYNMAISELSAHFHTDTHIEIAEMKLELAQVVMSLDRGDEAETLHKSALQTIIDLYGSSHLRAVIAQFSFVFLVMQREKIFLAFTVLEECEKAFKALDEDSIYLPECYQLKEEINNIIASLPDTANEAFDGQDYETAIMAYENLILLYSSNASYYHNCACAYHLLAIQQDKIEYFDKAQQYFSESLRREKRISTQVEYANFLQERGGYSEAITLLDEALGQPSDNSGRLSYGLGELPALPSDLAEKIKEEGAITICHPQFFAHYLKIECLVKTQASNEAIEACLVQFTDSLMNFYQTDPKNSLYDWLLENAYTLQEKHINAGTSLPFFETRSGASSSVGKQEKPYNP